MYFETLFSPDEIEKMRNGESIETRDKNGIAHFYRMVAQPRNGGGLFIHVKGVNNAAPNMEDF